MKNEIDEARKEEEGIKGNDCTNPLVIRSNLTIEQFER